MTDRVRIPLTIKIKPYLYDHRFMGKIVFPAVEAMELLAQCAKNEMPLLNEKNFHNASFDRFIAIAPESRAVEAFCGISSLESRESKFTLITVSETKSGIRRAKEHVSITYTQKGGADKDLPRSSVPVPTGESMTISRDKIYRECVPFGPAFHNIIDEASLSEEGAYAALSGGKDYGLKHQLGSPFPLDAAFHCASLWGQRYRGFVPFPVGITERRIFSPCSYEKRYVCTVTPVDNSSSTLLFDIVIMDDEGTLCEKNTGVMMRDVSGGRIKPPAWIAADL